MIFELAGQLECFTRQLKKETNLLFLIVIHGISAKCKV
jgi:hypothetical protein